MAVYLIRHLVLTEAEPVLNLQGVSIRDALVKQTRNLLMTDRLRICPELIPLFGTPHAKG